MTDAAPGTTPRADADPPRSGPLPWWAWGIAAVTIFATAVGSVVFAPSGTGLALWWPAAGLSVAFVLLQPRSRWLAAVALVLVVTALANGVTGLSIPVALAFGVGNALEAAVVFGVVRYGRTAFRLQSLDAGLRFALAVLVGSGVGAVTAGANLRLLDGGDFWSTAGIVAASNATAIALIAPFAILPRSIPAPARWPEVAVQAALLASVTLLVFWPVAVLPLAFLPAAPLPLAFLPFPYLAWAALRFSIRVVLAETLALSLLVIGLTGAGGGPFAASDLPMATGTGILQAFLITTAALAIVLSTAQYELRTVSQRMRESSQLLSGSLVEAAIGLAIGQEEDGRARITWSNPAAQALLEHELGAGGAWSGALRDAAERALASREQVTVEVGDRIITVAANDVDGGTRRFAVQLFDVTELLRARQAQVDADAAQESAQRIRAELERQRDDFLATTSHELRTPITSIMGYAELLSERDDVSEGQRAWLAIIDRNAHRLSELVEDLLTLSRGAVPRDGTQAERMRCAELFEEVTANLRVISEPKGLRIETAANDEHVLASRHDAVRALSNLLVNAIKFAEPGGRIRLSAAAEGDEVRLSIADTGPGMTDDEIAQAFVRFYRTPSAERGNVPGAGLGLPIVAELARRNGGDVALRRNEHSGITAELRLPAPE